MSSSSKRAPVVKDQTGSKHPDDAMDLDNQEQLILEPESPIDRVTGKFKASALDAKSASTSGTESIVPIDNSGKN